MLVSFLPSGWPFLVPGRRHSRAIFTVGRGQAVLSVPTAGLIESIFATTESTIFSSLPASHYCTVRVFQSCRDARGGMPLLVRRDKHCPLNCFLRLYRLMPTPPRSVVVASHTQPISTRKRRTFLERRR